MRFFTVRSKTSELLWALFLGLSLLCLSPRADCAQADQTKGLAPHVASVLRWLPEDTQTLIVARSVTVPNPVEAAEWQDYGVNLACQGLALDRQNQFRNFDLRLIPALKDVSEIPTGRKGLIIVAAVRNILHFRIFDGDGKLLVDTNEKRLPEQARQIGDLRKQIAGLWPPHMPKAIYNQSVIWAVTSLVDQAQVNPLRGRKIDCIVHGARNFEGVSSLGSLRSESCAIIVFDTDLGNAAREWTESLRKGAKAVRNLVGREVFVFPSSTSMEPWEKETAWQGTFLTLLEPNTVLCATSDRYLESVLRRVDGAPQARALPDNLPEWKQVDFDASVWMLRHVPKAGERANIIGSTTRFTKEDFRVVYLPKIGYDVNITTLQREWLPEGIFNTPKLRDQIEIVRQPDGTVVLSCGVKPGEDTFWFSWFQLYRLQAFELFLDDR